MRGEGVCGQWRGLGLLSREEKNLRAPTVTGAPTLLQPINGGDKDEGEGVAVELGHRGHVGALV